MLEEHPDKHPGLTEEKKKDHLEKVAWHIKAFLNLLDSKKREQNDKERSLLLSVINQVTRADHFPETSVTVSKSNVTAITFQPLSQRDAPSTEELLSKIPLDIEQNPEDSLDLALLRRQIADGGDVEEGTRGETQLVVKKFYQIVIET